VLTRKANRHIIIFCALAWALSAGAARAQLRVAPIIRELAVRPGAAQSFRLAVANMGTESLSCTISSVGMTLAPNGRPLAADRDGARSCAPWLTFDATQFELRPGVGREVQVTARAPRSAGGGYYALIRVVGRPPSTRLSRGARVAIGYEVDVAALATVVTPKLRGLLQPDLPALLLVRESGRTKWRASVRVTNKGNVHERVEGRADILDLDLRRVAEAPLSTGKGYVLPDGVREFQAEGSGSLRDGTYTVRVRLGRRGENPRLTAVSVWRVTDGRVEPADASPGALAAARAALGEFYVEPQHVEVKCAPGARRYTQIRMKNRSREAVQLSPRVLQWWVDRSGHLVISREAGKRSAGGWLEVAPETIALPPKGSGTLRLCVAPQRGLASGEYYAAVVLARPDESLPVDVSLLTDRTALVTVAVGDALSPKVAVPALSARPRSQGGFAFSFKVANDGNARAWPSARVTVTDAHGQRVEPTAEIDQDEWPLMPGTTRDYRAEWSRLLAPGSYTATVVVETPGQKDPVSARITFESRKVGEPDGTVSKRG